MNLDEQNSVSEFKQEQVSQEDIKEILSNLTDIRRQSEQ